MPDTTNPKFDPMLAELAQQPEPSEGRVVVMVALGGAPDESELAMLEAAGLATRSVVGDIATGTVAIADLARLAAVPLVVAIEGSRPLEPEEPP